jgi:hypothetical protein
MMRISPLRLQLHHLISAGVLAFSAVTCAAQNSNPGVANAPKPSRQINVNWLYGSYVPKDVPLESLDGYGRWKLYIRQTYTTPGIYVKTLLFGLHDEIRKSEPEWESGFEGFAKRLGNRQAQFIVQNSVISVGDGILRWEPRYDRCRCDGFWPRTRHALVRNFVTYDQSETALRPQLMPYFGAFGASVLATTWEPGQPNWQVQGYQAAIAQVFIGMGINFVSEFGLELSRVFHKKKQAGHSP